MRYASIQNDLTMGTKNEPDLRPRGGWTKAKGHMNVETGELKLETCRVG